MCKKRNPFHEFVMDQNLPRTKACQKVSKIELHQIVYSMYPVIRANL